MPFFAWVGHRPVFRTILRRITIVPLLHAVAASVLRDLLVERLAEGERKAVSISMPCDRQIKWFACITNALKAAIPERACLPPGGANDVKMTIARIECAAHRTRQETSWERNCRALRHIVHDVAEHEHHRTATPGEMEHVAGEPVPLARRHPDLAPAGVVGAVRNQ